MSVTGVGTTGFAERIGRIEVSATMAITAEALKMKAAGISLSDFGAGEPHFETPRHIKDAGIAAINEGRTRYTAVAGTPEVRKAICARHKADFGTDYTVEECVFTTGGKLALFNALQVLCDHGDEVILPVPYWVSYKDIIQYAGGVVKYVETEESKNFAVTAAMIEGAMTAKTKAIILCSPSNPSGAVMAQEDIAAIVKLANEKGVYVLLDECYVYLTFAGAPYSGASQTACKEHVVVLGSLSKTYAMTGWRAGFALGPKAVIAGMSKLQSQSTSSAAAFVQAASVAAVSNSQECVSVMKADYVALRDRVLAGLATIPGVTCTKPEGAFYVYPNVSSFGLSSAEIAARLLSEAHVVTVPGEAFGTEGFIRLSYAVSGDVIEEGVRRMRDWFAGLTG